MSLALTHEEVPTWLWAACEFIESNATRLLSEQDVARAVSIAPDELHSAFCRCLGFTPIELLEDVREPSSTRGGGSTGLAGGCL